MNFSLSTPCTAFAGTQRIASGPLGDLALSVQQFTAGTTQADPATQALVLVFDDTSGQQIELDLRGTPAEMTERLALRAAPADAEAQAAQAPRGPGRPKLGVVAREVTLLPRHWEWLGLQPGGASVALRKLVDQARHASSGRDKARQAQEAGYRFMSAMAGNQPGFEEASRALFAGDAASFQVLLQAWAPDVRAHALRLAAPAFEAHTQAATPEETT